MTAVLGVDGGQTSIRVRCSEDEREIERAGVGRQDGDVGGALTEAVADAWRQLGQPPLDRVVLGLTTAPVDRAESDRLAQLVARALGVAEVWVTDDAVTAHAGALSGRPGVSITAGTGVACLAVPAVGAPRIIGGHGFLLGDEGGGYWIGRNGLRAALRAADGRGARTTLESAAERRFGPLADVHVRLHNLERPVPAIAAFAPDVLAAADADDEVACAIVDEATDELLTLANAGAQWVGGGRAMVALGGPLLSKGTALRRRLEKRDEDHGAGLDLRDPEGSPLDGAIRFGVGGTPGPYRDLVHVWRRESA